MAVTFCTGVWDHVFFVGYGKLSPMRFVLGAARDDFFRIA